MNANIVAIKLKVLLIFSRMALSHFLPTYFTIMALYLCFRIHWTCSAKILGLFPHSSESHFVLMRTFMLELASRDHNITLYTGHRLDERLENLKEYIIEPEYEFWQEVQKQSGIKDNVLELSRVTTNRLETSLASAGFNLMEYFFSNYQVQKLLKLPADEFNYDIIIVDLFYTESLMAIGSFFDVPTIGIISSDFLNYMDDIQDNTVPAACLPYPWKHLNKNFGFWQRLNIYQCFSKRETLRRKHYAKQEKLIKKYFNKNGANTTLASISNLHANLALLLVNNYIPLVTPRPMLTNMIAVGGMQIRSPRALPWHIKRFLDESRSGVIYMHLGDHHLCSTIPKDQLRTLFKAFKARSERILWTCHDVESLHGLPDTVLLQHMVPQTDILAHPHVKLFIMSGDLFGLQEGIVRMTPMLALPLFENEFKNSELVEKLKIGARLDYVNMTTESLQWALKTIIGNEDFALNIRNVSKMFRDRPLGGLATAIFWLDYILQYGATPLRSPMVIIPLKELHLQDLFVYYFVLAIVIISTVALMVWYAGKILWKKHQTRKIFSKLN
uniref:UDP-glycosyltransferases domain-containing protein n=1 Tax=Glossina palpalis gambiensis TaxID=67801 RepID=A0A1B0BT17_9MUSC